MHFYTTNVETYFSLSLFCSSTASAADLWSVKQYLVVRSSLNRRHSLFTFLFLGPLTFTEGLRGQRVKRKHEVIHPNWWRSMYPAPSSSKTWELQENKSFTKFNNFFWVLRAGLKTLTGHLWPPGHSFLPTQNQTNFFSLLVSRLIAIGILS